MRKFVAGVAVALTTVFVQAASATINHGTFGSTNVTFIDVLDTSNSGDPEPLFGAPTGSAADTLSFSPNNFVASGNDYTGGLLRVDIDSNVNTFAIQTVNIFEFGDFTLLDPVADAGTGVFAGMSGGLRVEEVNGVAITPFVINFVGTFNPLGLGGGTVSRGTLSSGTYSWTGTASIDVTAALLANGYLPTDIATHVELALDNDLYSYLSGTGIQSKIQKKFGDAPSVIIEVVPEPGTFALVCGGLLALGIRARGRRV